MKSAELPLNERERLQALRCLDILDTPPEERYDRITRLAKKIFDVPIALVSLMDENRQWFKSIQGLNATELPRELSFCGHAILQPKPLVIEDTTTDTRFFDNPYVEGNPNIRFYAGCPLALDGGLKMGTLCVIDSKPREFSQEDIKILQDLAGIIETEIRNVNMATTDQLTGLSNRRGFSQIATHIFYASKRSGQSMSLFYIDLDKFKSINDQFGHEEGDKALKATAQILLKTFRDMDVIGRLGGDEFCVLCTDLEKTAYQSIEQRLKRMFQQYNEQSNKPYKLSCSVGALTFDPNQYDNFESLLQKTDELMYLQKNKQSKRG